MLEDIKRILFLSNIHWDINQGFIYFKSSGIQLHLSKELIWLYNYGNFHNKHDAPIKCRYLKSKKYIT